MGRKVLSGSRNLVAWTVGLLGVQVSTMEISWKRWRRAGLCIVGFFLLSFLHAIHSVFFLVLAAVFSSLSFFGLISWVGVGFLGLVRALTPQKKGEEAGRAT
jgi:hypothetical protein